MLEIWAHHRNVEGQPVVKTLIWAFEKKTSNYSFMPHLPSPFLILTTGRSEIKNIQQHTIALPNGFQEYNAN